jgi:hypothetical protein
VAEEGAIASFTLRVSFDDGPDVDVTVLPRDFLRLEQQERDAFDAQGNIRPHHIMVLAWLALSRQKRTKQLADTVPLPDTLEEFMDIADVTAEADPAGNPTAGAASTG